jgi:radical SAM superfamily enzyme YgiQ (UPF0313 family)
MRVTFIRPSMADDRAGDAMEPLVFAILAGLTPPDVETRLYDERLEAIPFDEPTDLVAMTVESFTARRSYEIAGEFRKRGVAVVMGGYHPTLCPDEGALHADSLAIGDAEAIWPRILVDAAAARLQSRYYGTPTPLGTVPFDRRVFAGKRYGPVRLLQVGRGCRFACDFCSIHAFYKRQMWQRPIAEIVAEIEQLGGGHIFITDDNLFTTSEYTEALFRALIPLKLRWSCQASIDIAQHPRLLKLMAKAGCSSLLIGFESLNINNLRQMKKAWNSKQGPFDEVVRMVHDQGIMIYGTFVFGYDHDTSDSFDIVLDFALRNKLFLTNFNPLMPTPGTALIERLRREGRMLSDPWWLDPDYHYGACVFQARGMSPEELEDGCFRLRSTVNSVANIAKRGCNFAANARSLYNLALFLTVNLTSRREIRRKQGLHLGHRCT